MKTLVGLVLGFVVGAFVSGLVMGVTAYLLIRKKEAEVRRGNELASAIVAARDLQPLHRITFDDISQRSVPRRLVTSSIVKPDSGSYVVKASLGVPLRAGDIIQWSYFVLPGGGLTPRDGDIFQGCLDEIVASPTAPKLESSIAEIRARLAGEAP